MSTVLYSNGHITVTNRDVCPSVAKALRKAEPDSIVIDKLTLVSTRQLVAENSLLKVYEYRDWAVTGSARCARCQQQVRLCPKRKVYALREMDMGGETLAFNGLVCGPCIDDALDKSEIVFGGGPGCVRRACLKIDSAPHTDGVALQLTPTAELLDDAREALASLPWLDCSAFRAELRKELVARIVVRVWKRFATRTRRERVQWVRYCALEACGVNLDGHICENIDSVLAVL